MKKRKKDERFLSRDGERIPQYNCKNGKLLDVYLRAKEINEALHTHTCYVLLQIKKGKGVHTIKLENIPIRNNQLFFIAPGVSHKLLYDNENVLDVAIPFTEDLLDLLPVKISNWIRYDLFNNKETSTFATIDAKTARVLNKWVEDINILNNERNTNTDYGSAALLSIILLYLKEHASWNNISNENDIYKLRVMNEFRKLLEERLRHCHSAAEYSLALGIAEHKLAAITNDLYGMSPKKLINKEILFKAKQLFAENKLIVKEIAEELGFNDASHFVNFIKRETKMTPKQLKDTLQRISFQTPT